MTKNKFYITNAIPYVNAKPHIGHALEFIQSDTIARYHHKFLKDDVYLSCGADENALKIVQAAEEQGIPIQELVDKNAELFRQLWVKLSGKEFDYFVKGSSPEHIISSQKLWKLCAKNGDIYKKNYKGLYCVGCEQFYTKDELDANLECFEHPGKKLEEVEEENYFFRLKKYQKDLLEIIKGEHKKYKIDIVPEKRKHEMLSFLERGLEDISISRSNKRAKNWGVLVPNDPTQRIYVWFDGLNIYQTSVGFGWKDELYKKLWPADLHVIGKGITRFHAIYWPAFLLSAGLELPKKIFVHDYITVDGKKMSKTLGNVLDPFPLIEKYGADALRYYLLAKISPFEDGDFSEEKFKEIYNADLANGLGNLVARVAKLCELIPQNYTIRSLSNIFKNSSLKIAFEDYEKKYKSSLENFSFNEALGALWEEILRILDVEFQKVKPWEYNSSEEKRVEVKTFLLDSVLTIKNIAFYLEPFLPETAEKIEKQFRGPKIKSSAPLFPRI